MKRKHTTKKSANRPHKGVINKFQHFLLGNFTYKIPRPAYKRALPQ